MNGTISSILDEEFDNFSRRIYCSPVEATRHLHTQCSPRGGHNFRFRGQQCRGVKKTKNEREWWNQSSHQRRRAFWLTSLDPGENAIRGLDAVSRCLTLMPPNSSHNCRRPAYEFAWPLIDFTLWLPAVTFTFHSGYLAIDGGQEIDVALEI